MKKLYSKKTIKNNDTYNDDGFSLVELVVAVGILLVLTVGGVFAYDGIMKLVRQAALDNAVAEIYTVGMANWADNDTDSNTRDVIKGWAESNNYYIKFIYNNDSDTNSYMGAFAIYADEYDDEVPLQDRPDILYYGVYVNNVGELKKQVEDGRVPPETISDLNLTTSDGIFVQLSSVRNNDLSKPQNILHSQKG